MAASAGVLTDGGSIRPLDAVRMQEALALAERAIGLSEPNPRVGCVLGFEDGRVAGRGHTQEDGGPHAEVMALRDAASQGIDLRGATAWVTLEPCAHHGRTPPCCDALIAAGVARVVIAAGDPFEHVNGEGLSRLRAAGVEVALPGGDAESAARELNIGFFSRTERGRPFVRLKLAASLDGRTALPDGRSQWITGPAARADTHAWRHRATAVLTGVGTVLADDPRLDVRLVDAARQPWRIVLDRSWRMPAGARLLQVPGRVVVVGTTGHDDRRRALEAAGAETVALEDDHAAPFTGLMSVLAARRVNELHVEAGPTLSGALLEAGLVDELLLYVAPSLLGDGLPLAHLNPVASLDRVLRFGWRDCSLVGTDLRLRLRSGSSTCRAT